MLGEGRGDIPPGAELLTYVELGERLGIETASAQRRAIRARWPRLPGNDGRARVIVPPGVLPDVRPDRLPAAPSILPDVSPTISPDIAVLSRLMDRLEALELEREEERAELAAEKDARATERLETAERYNRELRDAKERVSRAEAQGEAAQEARRVAEAAQARAESQVEALTAELREVRRPLWERVVRSLRG